jgi:hypothetical protein
MIRADYFVVYFLPNGGVLPNYSIDASHISSLDIVNPTPSAPVTPVPPSAGEFQDPAIVSVRCPNQSADI